MKIEPDRLVFFEDAPGLLVVRQVAEATGVIGLKETTMAREHIEAGTQVCPGTYQCNACANEYECRKEGEKLPLCPVCDSISWKTRRLASPGDLKKN